MAATEPDQLTLDQLRSERSALQAEEDAVSYARRLAQGRLDLVRAERRRRAAHDGATDISGELPDILGRQVGSGSGRPPRSTEVPADHHLVEALDEQCAELGFHDLGALDDAGLQRLVDGLQEFERARSDERAALFGRIDALTNELVRRYRDGAASVDSLLRD